MVAVSRKVLLHGSMAGYGPQTDSKFPGNRSSSEEQREPVDDDTTVVEPDQGNG